MRGSNSGGGVFWVGSYLKCLSPPGQVQILGGDSGYVISDVAKSSMRSSNSLGGGG